MKIATKGGKLLTFVGLFGNKLGVGEGCCCDPPCQCCISGTLPSAWSLEFHDCIGEMECLNGSTFVVDRIGFTVGDLEDPCAGYINTPCGTCLWINCFYSNSTFTTPNIATTFNVSVRATHATAPGGTLLVTGNYTVGDDSGDPDYRSDCMNEGSITSAITTIVSGFESSDHQFLCDVTPIA